jgi:hypothetical protein
LRHLESGLGVCAREGRLAFGSAAFDVFYRLDQERRGLPVDVYIYASHAELVRPQVSWRARYVGFVGGVLGGVHPLGMKLRPPTTEGENPWPLFWEVEDLRWATSNEEIATGAFTGFGCSRPYRDNFIPEGPILLEHP